jgi:hypothetical protein
VQQMTVDVEEIGIIANSRDDVLVPDFGHQRTAGLFQGRCSLLASQAGGVGRYPRYARLMFRLQPPPIKAQQATVRLERRRKMAA